MKVKITKCSESAWWYNNSYDSSFNYLLEQSEKYSLLRKNGIEYLVKKLMFTEQAATKLIDKLSTKQED